MLLGDVEDPELYASMPIVQWQGTEQGAWVMEHGKDIRYNIAPDPVSFGYKVHICGELEDRDLTYYYMRWGK